MQIRVKHAYEEEDENVGWLKRQESTELASYPTPLKYNQSN